MPEALAEFHKTQMHHDSAMPPLRYPLSARDQSTRPALDLYIMTTLARLCTCSICNRTGLPIRRVTKAESKNKGKYFAAVSTPCSQHAWTIILHDAVPHMYYP